MFRLANILLSRAGIDKLPAPQPFKTGAWRSDRPDNRGRAAMHHDLHERNWDYSKFGRGERFVYQPIPHSEFDEVMDQVRRWGLDQHLKERRFENLAAEVAFRGATV